MFGKAFVFRLCYNETRQVEIGTISTEQLVFLAILVWVVKVLIQHAA